MLVHCRLDPCGVTLIVLRVLVVLTNQHWTEHVHLTHVSHKKLCKLVLTFISWLFESPSCSRPR